MSLRLVPTDVQTARRFLASHRRRSTGPKRWTFAVGVANGDSDDLVGVAIAGRPMAQALRDGRTMEVVCCSDSTANAPLMVYAAVARAARALGYKRVITYAVEKESGTTLRACDWRPVAAPRDRSRHKSQPHHGASLFGRPQALPRRMLRWERRFDVGPPPKEWPAEPIRSLKEGAAA